MEFITYVIDKLLNVSGFDKLHYTDILFYLYIVVSAFFIELLFVGWDNSSLKRLLKFDKTVRTDFICYVLVLFSVFNLIAFVFSLGVCYYLVGLIQKTIHLDLIVHIANPYLQFAIVFLVADLKNYWRHRVFHNYKPLWKIHEFHHAATSLNIITRYRGHFLETAISMFFDVLPFVILGAPIHMYFAVKILSELHQLFIHSSLKSDWGFIGKYILVSPAAHRVHHSIDSRHFQKNLGNTFIFWDRLFATYHPSVAVEAVGLPDNQYNKKGFWVDTFIGMKEFVLQFRK